MYRDDPLDDEFELRAIVGDDAVDRLPPRQAGQRLSATELALDLLRLLQGWAEDDEVARWFLGPQRRLGGRSPIDMLTVGAFDEVEDAARAWVAARG